jgi:purine catabolism regulator
MLTISELLADLDVRLLAGEESLDQPVRWVHITELPDPTPFLSGGELLLTTGMALTTAKAQREFVARLAEHGLAGRGVGTGFGYDKVPEAMVKAAADLGFPLFEVPYELPFIALTERAFARLVNEQYALLQRSIVAQERLQRIVLSERGLEAIAGQLATLIGGAALVFDGRGEPLAHRSFRRAIDDELIDAVGNELRDRARRGEGREFLPMVAELGGRALALPVASPGATPGAVPQAWLVAAKDQGGLAEIDRLILHQAVTVVALELLRVRVADATERRLAGDVLNEIVAGDVEGPELQRRLEPFGLGGRITVLALAPGAGESSAALEAAVTTALHAEAVTGLVASTGRFVGVLLPGFLDEELFDTAERLVARVATTVGADPHAGAGRAVPAGRAREAGHEARCALEARELGADPAEHPGRNGTPAGQPTRVATYRDLGSFQLLLALQDTDALRLFCDSLLGPIEEGEGHYGGELMRSLEAFIECNGQWESAARRLYCHRHTLRYRIRKIEELTGRDLARARDRIEFWLALRGREMAPSLVREPR